jgi:ATP-dependent DNA helicase RecQ
MRAPRAPKTQEWNWDEVRAEAWERFGVRRFRRGQRELIEAALSGRDAVGLLPTGAGKSLCFQLPAMFLEGTTVVVSPLISLMMDQTDKLSEANVDAARLDSTLTASELRLEERSIRRGRTDLVYLTPERLENADWLETLRSREVALFVVDEAHCVSQWGHDFRPAYLGLKDAMRALGRPPILALTATAPPDVIADIQSQLGMDAATVVSTGIERDNLFFEVRSCPTVADKHAAVREAVAGDGPGIVYAATIRLVNEIYEWLRSEGVLVERYHGKLKAAEREEAQRRFMSGEAPVMVATSAFGMGIDKQDLRYVLHWNYPDSLETYYQEAGRAGRDGKPARAILLYRAEDRRIVNFFLGGRYPKADELFAVWMVLAKAGVGAWVPIAKMGEESGIGARRGPVVAALLEDMKVVERRGARARKKREFPTHEAWLEFLSAYERRHDADRERLELMVRYAQTALCRTQMMREYFGEERGDPCGHCDGCRDRPELVRQASAAPPSVKRLRRRATVRKPPPEEPPAADLPATV